MENTLSKVLSDVGLSQKEAHVYLTMLKTGHNSILKISQATEIKRSSLYLIMDALVKKELVKVGLRAKKKIFLAQDPEEILKQINERKYNFKQILPDLKDLYGRAGEKPSIRHYEGKAEVKNALKKYLKSKTEILWFGTAVELENEYPELINRTYKYAKNNPDFPGYRALFNYNKKNKELIKERNKDKTAKMKRRLIDKNLYFKDSINVIYDNKLLIVSVKSSYFALEIDSKIVTDAYRVIFDLAWRSAIVV